MLKENTLFAGRYRLERLLGRGGFSEVWLAEDSKTMIRVAVKIYAPGTGLDEDGVKLFTREFSLVFNLNHSNLLRPTHYDDYERQPFLVLPYCERGSALKLVGNISEEEAWKLLQDISAGLEYLHSKEPPVIHSDIKPDNILIDSDGRYMITDFGISTKVRSTLRKSVNKGVDESAGTTAYMGPERFGREPSPIKASDIWSVGAMMYELLTGDVPFGNLGGIIQMNGALVPFVPGDYSPALKELIEKCLSKEPWDRPTAEEIRKQSQAISGGNPLSSEEIKVQERDRTNKMVAPFEKNPKQKSGNGKKRPGLWIRIGGAVFAGVSLSLLLIPEGRIQKDTVVLQEATDSVLVVSKIAEIPVAAEIVRPANAQEEESSRLAEEPGSRIDSIFIAPRPKIETVSPSEKEVAEVRESSRKSIVLQKIKEEPALLPTFPVTWDSSVTATQKRILTRLIGNMVRIQGGTFLMGATEEQGSDAPNSEKPVHEVRLSNYAIGRYEVRQSEWKAVMGSNPSRYRGDDRPVESVSWSECQEFIWKLKRLTGLSFRLPTEAEWEYAARGGQSRGTKFAGSDRLGEVGWYDKNSGGETHPVGNKVPNGLGLYDMTGNVNEWCSDWYEFGGYKIGSKIDPQGGVTGEVRILRGGDWNSLPGVCRVSCRDYARPARKYSTTGLRLTL